MKDKKHNIPTRIHIGTQKAASTFLYNLLKSHPGVSLSVNTEINFYSKFYDRGMDWYLSTFKSGGVRIDTSPKYFMYGSIVAPRIQKALGDQQPKLLLVLRNPIDYLNSHFQMHLTHGFFAKNPDKYPKQTKDITQFVKWYPQYLDHAKYYKIFSEQWLASFPQKNFKIVAFEDLIHNTETVCDQILTFWGLPECKLTASQVSKNRMMRNHLLFKLRAFVVRNERLKNIFKNSAMVNFFYEHVFTVSSSKKLSLEQRRYLHDILCDDVRALENVLGKEMPVWNDFHENK